MVDERAFIRWQTIRQNQLSYVNDILIILKQSYFFIINKKSTCQFDVIINVNISTLKLRSVEW
ncbi:MAG: hypothetical protein LN408_06315, partial [Candidatus Thermoplasmatota archaeon]|nr:hypothetical protein [Candidatus Thermoplasmatota archaeon]